MTIYDKPVCRLMHDMVADLALNQGDLISRTRVMSWFATKYPKVTKGSIQVNLSKVSTNSPSRVHFNVKPGTDDLFFQVDGSHFRLFNKDQDPAPIYDSGDTTPEQPLEADDNALLDSEFAFESDLRDYLARNLVLLEPGLALFEEEGITGIEFPVGGRSIDILAVAKNRDLVVIELKVSKGYDRTVGQLLRYMGWIEENLAEPGRQVRGIIVAREVTEDLLLACRRLSDVSLFSYQLSVAVKRVSRTAHA